jgi:hypothetical protein
VKSFLVDSYTPAAGSPTDIEASARRATGGTSARYVRSIFVPDDEICFHLLKAPSADSVDAVIRAAGIQHQRIMEVKE